MHRVLKTWMVEAGQPVTRPWLDGPPADRHDADAPADVSIDPAAG